MMPITAPDFHYTKNVFKIAWTEEINTRSVEVPSISNCCGGGKSICIWQGNVIYILCNINVTAGHEQPSQLSA